MKHAINPCIRCEVCDLTVIVTHPLFAAETYNYSFSENARMNELSFISLNELNAVILCSCVAFLLHVYSHIQICREHDFSPQISLIPLFCYHTCQIRWQLSRCESHGRAMMDNLCVSVVDIQQQGTITSDSLELCPIIPSVISGTNVCPSHDSCCFPAICKACMVFIWRSSHYTVHKCVCRICFKSLLSARHMSVRVIDSNPCRQTLPTRTAILSPGFCLGIIYMEIALIFIAPKNIEMEIILPCR